MNVSELRIGNIVEHGYVHSTRYSDGRLGCYIIKSGFDSSCGVWFSEKDIKPIPIDEDWLLGFGFENDFSKSFKLGVIRIELGIDNKWGFRFIESINTSVFMTEIKHVHQLQNLYFAITGTELTRE